MMTIREMRRVPTMTQLEEGLKSPVVMSMTRRTRNRIAAEEMTTTESRKRIKLGIKATVGCVDLVFSFVVIGVCCRS
jgi:hypothetical protein